MNVKEKIEQAIKAINAARINIELAAEESDSQQQTACYGLAMIQMGGAIATLEEALKEK